jgi:hypothetical protein
MSISMNLLLISSFSMSLQTSLDSLDILITILLISASRCSFSFEPSIKLLAFD